jgi:hypothetical protein
VDAMSAPGAVVEWLDRNGRVEQRVMLRGDGVRIGRAYDNDLILDDVHVSPHHAQILMGADGRWMLRDLGSVNGIRAGGSRKPITELVLSGEQTFSLGHAQLRFRPTDLPVPEAVPLRERRHLHVGLLLALCIPLACLGAFGVDALLDSHETFGALKLLNAVLIPFVAMLIWAGIWALIGRLMVQRLHFLGHLAVISFGLLFGTVFESIAHQGAFALSLDSALPWALALISCATFVLIVYGHLRLASRLRPRTVFAAAVIFGVLLAGAAQIRQLVYMQQFAPRPRFNFTLASPVWRFVRADTTQAFYAQTSDLTKALEEDVAKPPAAPKGK